jgi:hypothetical protein
MIPVPRAVEIPAWALPVQDVLDQREMAQFHM